MTAAVERDEAVIGKKAAVAGLALPAGLLLLSGFASLIFQLVWIKQLTLVVGVEVHAISTAVGAFFAGLGLGSLAWGRVAERIGRPLRLYGLLEFGAAGAGVVTTLLLSRAAPAFARLEDVDTLLAWSLPVALVGIPAFLMGGTLPVLMRFTAPGERAVGRAGGRLYAANTLGAAAGALMPPFLLIPALGVQGTAVAAAAVGLLAAGMAMLVDVAAPAIAETVRKGTPREASQEMPHSGRGQARLALCLYGGAGGVALGYEIVWSQAVVSFMSTRVFAFSVVLVTYLAGLAIGSAVHARFADRTREAGTVFGLLIAAAGLAALLGVASLGPWLTVAQTSAESLVLGVTGSDLAGMCARFAVAAAVVVLPCTILLGAAFPAALRMIVRDGESGRGTGAALAANTLGGVAGSLLTGFVLVPRLGIVHTLGVLAVAAALIGMIAAGWTGRLSRWGLLLPAAAFVALAITVALPANRLATLALRGSASLAFYEEGEGGTVAVTEQGAGERRFRRLYIQGVSNSGDAMPSLRYMRLQALLPLIIHGGEPRSVLVIGYGTGITAGATLRYPGLQRRVVAELLPGVIHAAPLFQGTFGAFSDPGLETRLRDGRRELQRSGERYDMITLEPPPPSAAGVVNLYSRDFYRLAASRLEEGGILAQWLPLPTQNEDDTRSLVRSFIDVFPHASLWTTELHEMLLVGSFAPTDLDLGRIRRRYGAPDVASALRDVGLASPEALLATFVMGRQGLESFAGDARPVTDDDPRIEYAAWVRPADFGSVLPDLLNLREEVPLVGADADARAAVEARREELLTFYHAGMNAFAGNRQGWAQDMQTVLAADRDNPYYLWAGGR